MHTRKNEVRVNLKASLFGKVIFIAAPQLAIISGIFHLRPPNLRKPARDRLGNAYSIILNVLRPHSTNPHTHRRFSIADYHVTKSVIARASHIECTITLANSEEITALDNVVPPVTFRNQFGVTPISTFSPIA